MDDKESLMRSFCALCLAIVLGLIFAPASAQEFKAGDIRIDNAWAPASPKGAMAGAGYLVIHNDGAMSDRLTGGTADFASLVLHEMTMVGGVMKMGELKDGLEIAAHGSVTLAPGGSHIMFMDLKHSLVKGQSVRVTLTFEHAGSIPVDFSVNASYPAPGAKGMDMKGMKM